MTEKYTRYELRGRAAWITLNSPENRNALSPGLTSELHGHMRAAIDDSTARCIVITGTGRAFCAGAQLKQSDGDTQTESPQNVRGNPFVDILQMMWEGPKPVISAVNGYAFGGGLGLVAAADISIASEEAVFSFSEVRIGVIPAMISVVVLPKIGAHQTMRLFLTGERFDAAQAVGYGLIHRAVPAAALEEAVEADIDAIARGGPNAVREAKQLVRRVPKLSLEEGFAWTAKKSAEMFASEEAAEGMAAFATKRKPRWIS
jgi:methylglutaconyl-CoA hydratase